MENRVPLKFLEGYFEATALDRGIDRYVIMLATPNGRASLFGCEGALESAQYEVDLHPGRMYLFVWDLMKEKVAYDPYKLVEVAEDDQS